MSGVKGRSGRHTFAHNINIDTVLNQSIKIIAQFFNSPDFTLQQKADIAARFALKRVPDLIIQRTMIDVGLSQQLINQLMQLRGVKPQEIDLDAAPAVIKPVDSIDNNLLLIDNQQPQAQQGLEHAADQAIEQLADTPAIIQDGQVRQRIYTPKN